MELIHISWGGPLVTLEVSGEPHTFEMHPYCGPIKLHQQTLEPLHGVWPEKHPFWKIFQKWVNNGQKIDSNGNGIIPTYQKD